MLNYSAGNYFEAVEDLTQHLKMEPSDTSAWAARGAAYFKSNMLDKAEADLKKAVELEYKVEKTAKQYEQVRASIEKNKRIKMNADRSKSKSQKDIKALEQSAKANFNLGSYDEAIEDAKNLYELNPGDTTAIKIMAKSYYAKNDTNALKVFLRNNLNKQSRKLIPKGIINKAKLSPRR